jgi:hypothetical protein
LISTFFAALIAVRQQKAIMAQRDMIEGNIADHGTFFQLVF